MTEQDADPAANPAPAWWDGGVERVSPVIATFGLFWNKDLPENERDTLLGPLAGVASGTRGTPAVERWRAALAADWLFRIHIPAWLHLAGLMGEAEKLAGLPELTDMADWPGFEPLLTSIGDDAISAGSGAMGEAWDEAARQKASRYDWDENWDLGTVTGPVGEAAEGSLRAAAWGAAWNTVTAAPWGDTWDVVDEETNRSVDPRWEPAWNAAWAPAVNAAWPAAWAATRSMLETFDPDKTDRQASVAPINAAASSAVQYALAPTRAALQQSALTLLRRMTDATDGA